MTGRASMIAALWLLHVPAWGISDVDVKLNESSRSGIYDMEATAIMEASPAAVRQSIMRTCQNYKEVGGLKYCRVFRVEGKTAWSYGIVAPPIINPRDYTMKRTVVQDLGPDGLGTFRATWVKDDPAGPGPRSGVVRVPVNEGEWRVETLDGGKRSRVTYHIIAGSGGRVPSFIGTWIAKRTVPGLLKRVDADARASQQKGAVLPLNLENPWSPVEVLPLPSPLP